MLAGRVGLALHSSHLLSTYVFHVYHQSGKDQTLFLLLFSSELTVMIEMFGAGCRNGE